MRIASFPKSLKDVLLSVHYPHNTHTCFRLPLTIIQILFIYYLLLCQNLAITCLWHH